MENVELDTPTSVAILFMAMSTADKDMRGEEGFIAEKCADEFGLTRDEWDAAVTRAADLFFKYTNEVVEEALTNLSLGLDTSAREEIMEDLYLVAISDGALLPKEEEMLRKISTRWNVALPEL